MRKPLIAANWKMHKTVPEAMEFVREFLQLGPWGEAEALICPPYTCLPPLAEALDGSGVLLGAQNLHWDTEGAFTGEVSGKMLSDLKCDYVIVGHSERRLHFGDTDERVSLKIRAAYRNGLRPILCVGESLEQREAGRAADLVSAQVGSATKALSPEEVSLLVIAYEPIWAIGTGRSAQVSDAVEMARTIRGVIGEISEPKIAEDIRILYGGSVKPDNAGEFLKDSDIDGALVGGASLDPISFRRILTSAT